MSVSAATMPTAAMPAPTTKAPVNPCTSADGARFRPRVHARSATLRSSTATRCRARRRSLRRVEQTGRSPPRRPTPASAAIEIGTNEKPRPTPTSRKPGSRSPTYVPSTETCVKYTSPARQRDHPGDEHRLHADAVHELRRDARPEDRRSRRLRGTRRRSSSGSSRAPAACTASASGTARTMAVPRMQPGDVCAARPSSCRRIPKRISGSAWRRSHQPKRGQQRDRRRDDADRRAEPQP